MSRQRDPAGQWGGERSRERITPHVCQPGHPHSGFLPWTEHPALRREMRRIRDAAKDAFRPLAAESILEGVVYGVCSTKGHCLYVGQTYKGPERVAQSAARVALQRGESTKGYRLFVCVPGWGQSLDGLEASVIAEHAPSMNRHRPFVSAKPRKRLSQMTRRDFDALRDENLQARLRKGLR